VDLAAHLTNTSLHNAEDVHDSESFVKLLSELVGRPVLGTPREDPGEERLFTTEDLEGITSQMKEILAETFKAALANPVHFMVCDSHFAKEFYI
jgi:hypothetical protein